MKQKFATHLSCLTVPVLLAATAIAQRPTAIVNANILTMAGKPIAMGTILIRNGKIEDVAQRVKVPPGARIIDAKGGTVMPGLVSAYSRAGLGAAPRAPINLPPRFRGRFRFTPQEGGGGGAAGNRAAAKVVAGLYERQDVFGELLRQGVTTLAISPSGGGFPGRGAILNPAGKTIEALTIDDAAFVVVSPQNDTKTKELLKKAFEDAKKVLEERKKPKAPPPAQATPGKPATASPTSKPAATDASKTPPAKTPPATSAPATTTPATSRPATQPQRKDENLEVLADLVDGKTRAFLCLDSATDVAHYLGAVGELKYPCAILARSVANTAGQLADRAADLKKLGASVLMPIEMSSRPFTNHLIHPAAELRRQGIDVGFILGDSEEALRTVMPRLMELVRYGLDRDAALAAVTSVPAKMLGLSGKVGRLEKGLDADLLLFDGDPLQPTTRLKTVFLKGEEVRNEEEND